MEGFRESAGAKFSVCGKTAAEFATLGYWEEGCRVLLFGPLPCWF